MTATAPNILLVGGSGRVGRLVRHHWPSAVPAASLMNAHRQPPLHRHSDPAVFGWNPIDGPADLIAHLSRNGQTPAAMIVLAGVTAGPGIDASALAQNTQIAQACLAGAKASGIDRVLVASSVAVYGTHRADMPFSESAPTRPVSAYGQAKLEMEQAFAGWRQDGLNVSALRIGNVVGADALLGPLTGRQHRPEAPLRIDAFADALGPLRSYIGGLLLARVLGTLALHPSSLPDVINIAAPVPLRMTALAAAAGLPFTLVAAPPAAIQTITLDCARLEGLCPLQAADNDPAAMVDQWKASWS